MIEAERRTRGDLEVEELIVSIEVARRQEKTRQADLCIKITVDGGVSLQIIR